MNESKSCEQAAKFFDGMADHLQVTPKQVADAGGVMVDMVSSANLLEGCLIRIYKDHAAALRSASIIIERHQKLKAAVQKLLANVTPDGACQADLFERGIIAELKEAIGTDAALPDLWRDAPLDSIN